MNEALVTLMLITTTGFYTGPQFDTFEECEALSSEITHFTTFCHYKEPAKSMEEYGQQLDDFLQEFRTEAGRKQRNHIPEANL